MPRGPRGNVAAGTYHVYTRTAGKIPLFRGDDDRTDFCNRIGASVVREAFRCISFVLLTNHYHLIVEVEENRLQPAMKWLNGTYAQRFNRRHDRWGHLCGSRYSAVPVESRRQFRRAYRYLALNPVRSGLCELPEDWMWSSYAGAAGYSATVFRFVDDSRMLDVFGDDLGLRAFVQRAVSKS